MSPRWKLPPGPLAPSARGGPESLEVVHGEGEARLVAELDAERGAREAALDQYVANAPVDARLAVERHLGVDAAILDPGGVRALVQAREHARTAPVDDRRRAF